MNFNRRLEVIFIFQATVLKFGDLLAGLKLVTTTKFQHNIPKITPTRPKKNTRTWDLNTSLVPVYNKYLKIYSKETTSLNINIYIYIGR